MPLVRFPDAAGKTLQAMEYGQQPYYSFSTLPQEVLENTHNVHIRDDDVILCSYPKTGCHWLWKMTRQLRVGTTNVEMVEKLKYMIERIPQDQLVTLPPQRTLNTQVLFHQLPQKVQDGKVKILFIYRNPKDVAVSFYKYHRKCHPYEYHGEFSDYLPGLFLAGKIDNAGYFSYIRDWEREMDSRHDLTVFVLSYEELQADTLNKAKELAKFLESSADDATIQDIVDKCSLVSMRERNWHSGDWKNWFTVAQSQMMDQVIQNEMQGSRFRFQYML
ncbi:hypothetical protein ACOMHN_029733 [Nucella lapillus]